MVTLPSLTKGDAAGCVVSTTRGAADGKQSCFCEHPASPWLQMASGRK